ncbi:MAG TPA: phosphoenolpyruvate carboxylase [Microbacterium sp.]|nr:phosphoenolpyruvate carboxylase [Microbacterium sp.]
MSTRRPRAASKSTPPSPARRQAEDQPLIEDIRLLGRILGDVIREQEGAATFELVEKIRTLSVAFRRDADHSADRALKQLLKGLSAAETVRVIRAFTYFSHLANLAEDRHQIRRRSEAERADEAIEGSLDVALARIRKAGVTPAQVAQSLAHSYLSPVLTAHPTEVQRKSILDAERGIALLLTQRDEIRARQAQFAGRKDALSPRELAENEAQLRTRVTQLWQTRLLRFTKLTVADEIENALSYYEATFLREIPRVYAALEQALGQQDIAPFFRMGQWIGGDRDGNPNVTAETLDYALRRQCELALRHYLTEAYSSAGTPTPTGTGAGNGLAAANSAIARASSCRSSVVTGSNGNRATSSSPMRNRAFTVPADAIRRTSRPRSSGNCAEIRRVASASSSVTPGRVRSRLPPRRRCGGCRRTGSRGRPRS